MNPMNAAVVEHAPKTDKKWGAEYLLVSNEKYCSKILVLNYGFQSSLHYHKLKDETFICIEGRVFLEVRDRMNVCGLYQLEPGSSPVRLEPNTPHRFYAGNIGGVVLEVGTPHSDEDVYRIEESRVRGETC